MDDRAGRDKYRVVPDQKPKALNRLPDLVGSRLLSSFSEVS